MSESTRTLKVGVTTSPIVLIPQRVIRLTTMVIVPTTDWNPVLRHEFEKPYWRPLQDFVRGERDRGSVFPPHDEVFAALHLTSYAHTRVVILGQDPYHGPGKPTVCASRSVVAFPLLRRCATCTRSCTTISAVPSPLTEISNTGRAKEHFCSTPPSPSGGGAAASHQGRGWENFTDAVISAVAAKPTRVVFLLWGAASRKKRSLIDGDRHVVIESAHPSPLSAHNGFLGSRPFSRTNQALRESGQEPIDWAIPD